MSRSLPAGLAGVGALLLLAACTTDAPSTLDTRGPAASSIATLWWVMLALGTAVFVVTTVLLLAAGLRPPPERGPRALVGAGNPFIAFWGIAVPAVVLVALLILQILVGAETYVPPSEPELTVEVVGLKFWWEVRYDDEGFVTANEVHIPVGEPVRLRLESADVIHSFWVPQLHGKMDMIPGHTNEFWIQADEPGEYRGICAEYCGIQHGQMHFLVVASERDEFEAWLADRREPPPAADGDAARGGEVFVEANCIACHAVEGLRERTRAGPDLSDFAQRRTIAAGMQPNDREHLREWILDPQASKPGARMPPTPLDDDDLEALLDYLETLE